MRQVTIHLIFTEFEEKSSIIVRNVRTNIVQTKPNQSHTENRGLLDRVDGLPNLQSSIDVF